MIPSLLNIWFGLTTPCLMFSLFLLSLIRIDQHAPPVTGASGRETLDGEISGVWQTALAWLSTALFKGP